MRSIIVYFLFIVFAHAIPLGPSSAISLRDAHESIDRRKVETYRDSGAWTDELNGIDVMRHGIDGFEGSDPMDSMSETSSSSSSSASESRSLLHGKQSDHPSLRKMNGSRHLNAMYSADSRSSTTLSPEVKEPSPSLHEPPQGPPNSIYTTPSAAHADTERKQAEQEQITVQGHPNTAFDPEHPLRHKERLQPSPRRAFLVSRPLPEPPKEHSDTLFDPKPPLRQTPRGARPLPEPPKRKAKTTQRIPWIEIPVPLPHKSSSGYPISSGVTTGDSSHTQFSPQEKEERMEEWIENVSKAKEVEGVLDPNKKSTGRQRWAEWWSTWKSRLTPRIRRGT